MVTAPGRLAWPGGAKLAVLVTVMVELWSARSWPPYAPMATAWPLPGVPDRHSISWSRYGVNAGAWRLLRILGEHGLPATFGISGLVCEQSPELVRAVHEAGHEIAAHSWNQDVVPALLDREAEEANLTRCLTAVERLTGRAPTGWMSPRAGSSAHTPDLLAAHGLTWWGDHNDRDLPTVIPTGAGPLVAIMHSDFTDVRGTGGPSGYLQDNRDLLAALLAGPDPAVLNVTVHAHVGGRPLLAAMVDRVLADLRDVAGSIWPVTHQRLAQHVLAAGADPSPDPGAPRP